MALYGVDTLLGQVHDTSFGKNQNFEHFNNLYSVLIPQRGDLVYQYTLQAIWYTKYTLQAIWYTKYTLQYHMVCTRRPLRMLKHEIQLLRDLSTLTAPIDSASKNLHCCKKLSS